MVRAAVSTVVSDSQGLQLGKHRACRHEAGIVDFVGCLP